MDEKRLVVALFGLVVTGILGFLAYHFIAALTVSVFLYYSTRKFHARLKVLRLPSRVRAVIVLTFLAVPLLGLLGYTVLMVVVEVRNFIINNPEIQSTAEEAGLFEGIEEVPELSLNGLVQAYRSGNFDPIIDFFIENADFLQSTVSGLLLNSLIVIVVTYYLLVDGWRARRWLENKFQRDEAFRSYLEAADEELEAVLYGNLLNVLAISLIATVTYLSYNLVVPAQAEVPFPALAGALTGVASLIPVIGMKIVYIPLAAAAAVPLLVSGQYEPLVYIGVFLALVVVVVDTIPDIFLRPYFSGDRTHVGLLLLAYIFGPVVLGFYGLFFAPIVLVLTTTFADEVLPELLGADGDQRLPPDQTRLSDFRSSRFGGAIDAVRSRL